ncbi:MAG: hypothetical protein C3F08_00730 [Candidatus Methylomirabilota bacterium]|nr:MAG: hypothetical protein C3F08_00730 [candidate division NC10 bacterium]
MLVVLLISGGNESQQPLPPVSGVAYTNSGYFGCASKETLDDMITFVVAKDAASMKEYIDSGKCLMLKGGVKVTVTGCSIGEREFVLEGVKLHALAEALRN